VAELQIIENKQKKLDQNFLITQIHLPLPSSKKRQVRKERRGSSLQA
jgi:hypothetical protein